MQKKEVKTFYPEQCTDWQTWLHENHLAEQAVWLVFYNKHAGKATISWSNAVDIALCYGWIDSKKQKIDANSYRQYFSKRKPNSTWSKVNKEKIIQLIADGKMTPAGQKCIDIAKQNGSWTLLDEVENLSVPADLQAAFEAKPGTLDFFREQSKSTKKMMLAWIVLAKRAETRQKRIDELALQASQGQKPKKML